MISRCTTQCNFTVCHAPNSLTLAVSFVAARLGCWSHMRLYHCCKAEASVTYHKAGFHSFEGLFVSSISDHLALVDEGEGVTDSSSLLEPVGPAHGHALQS